jgi:uncharacterized membrane protein
MRAEALALLVLVSIVAGALAFFAIYTFVPREQVGMGRGVGGPQYYAWVPVLIVGVTFTVGLLGYVALFPDIEKKHAAETVVPKEQRSLEAVLRVLKDDERKVVELLMNSDGTMLQNDIARKTGFSRVKTHRILYRLSARGIVTAKKYYNTYQISVADWLR